MRIMRLSSEGTTETHATGPSFRSPLFGVRTGSGLKIGKSFSCSTPLVLNCHATRRKHEDWDTVRLSKLRREAEIGGSGLKIGKSFSCSTPLVLNCHATRRKHEDWDTVRLSKLRREAEIGFEPRTCGIPDKYRFAARTQALLQPIPHKLRQKSGPLAGPAVRRALIGRVPGLNSQSQLSIRRTQARYPPICTLMVSPRMATQRLQFNCQARRTDQQPITTQLSQTWFIDTTARETIVIIVIAILMVGLRTKDAAPNVPAGGPRIGRMLLHRASRLCLWATIHWFSKEAFSDYEKSKMEVNGGVGNAHRAPVTKTWASLDWTVESCATYVEMTGKVYYDKTGQGRIALGYGYWRGGGLITLGSENEYFFQRTLADEHIDAQSFVGSIPKTLVTDCARQSNLFSDDGGHFGQAI
ncbi:hypothetical protein T265_09580 [Opisthorchis viverrini]|uniref:Uncharacterized protein n=1 Tax=Opisthorchis viverrini TaxID=6198 RepID=A0A075A4G3_OPIVI|nr:hypothetical protein T265_09580 [Opisthorchis viverrini]KER22294.1 hypothetical protein T265_09580 [Opisthorchis viverrini]